MEMKTKDGCFQRVNPDFSLSINKRQIPMLSKDLPVYVTVRAGWRRQLYERTLSPFVPLKNYANQNKQKKGGGKQKKTKAQWTLNRFM